MIDPNATFEELYGDVTHADWCDQPEPDKCEGECQQPVW